MLRKPRLDSIGAHVYGGTFNSASVIGRYGNPYNDYINGFDVKLANKGLNLIPLRVVDSQSSGLTNGYGSAKTSQNGSTESSASQGRRGYSSQGQNGSGTQSSVSRSLAPPTLCSRRSNLQYGATADEEAFLDILKGAVGVGAPLLGGVLKTGLPIALGPLGGPIGALAGFALNAAGKLAESTDAESFDAFDAQEGTMERAILAEAAFTAVQTMDLHPDDQESIFSDMKDYVMKAAPTIKKVAPHVMGAMVEPALRVALNSLHNNNQKGISGAEAFEDQDGEPFRLNVTYSDKIDQIGDRTQEAFVRGLQNAMQLGQESFDEESEEGFFDVIKAGVRFAGKGVIAGARAGLPILAQLVGGGAESIESGNSAPTALSSTDLAMRALVGEAALQAIMKLPPQRLEEEGFFDSMVKAVKEIAPVVVKVAPTIISNLAPVMGGLIRAATGQEATFADTIPLALGPKTSSSKRSAATLRRKVGEKDFLSKAQEWHAEKGSY